MKFEDKCMGWNWFLPLYVQLVLVQPILARMYFPKRLTLTVILYSIVFAIFYIINFGIIVMKNNTDSPIGVNPASTDTRFYAEVFMKPWYHINSFLMGICMCLMYEHYLENRRPAGRDENNTDTLLRQIEMNGKIRMLLYFFGLGFMMMVYWGAIPYYKDGNHWSSIVMGLYGTFAYNIFAFGLALTLTPALVGKAQFVRFLFGGAVWNCVANVAFPILLVHSTICIFFFLSISNYLHLDY